MADTAPGTAPLSDNRVAPRGVLPRGTQTWLMVGLALGILGIIVFAGHPEPAKRTASAATPAALAPQTDRLRDYQDRLRTTGTPLTDPSAATPPNLDEVADAVVRATTRYAPPTAALTGTPSAAPKPNAAAATTTANATTSKLRPVATGPIASDGPTHRLLEGTVIDTVLTNRLDGSVAAPVDCCVTNPVYTHDGHSIVIPAGSRVLGETKPVQTFGETRLAVAFTRLVLPAGRTLRLAQ